jgi:3-oxoadipate enol-lactonase
VQGNPRGTPVVFSNSLAADHTMWDDQMAALERDYCIVRYDTRGHGASSAPPGDYDLDDLADDVLALLDHLGHERAHFVGLSLGGAIGQVLGARHGDRLLSLALCDTIALMPAGIWTERVATARAQGVGALAPATLERWFTPAFHAAVPDTVARVGRMIAATSVAGYAGCAAALRDLDLTALLGQIRVPTLVMVGADDPSTPVAASERIHQGIAGSKLVVIPDAAHLSNIEQTGAFNRALCEFLNEVEETSGSRKARMIAS